MVKELGFEGRIRSCQGSGVGGEARGVFQAENSTGKTLEEKEQILSEYSEKQKIIPPEPFQYVILKKYINFRCINIFLVYK